MTVRDRSCLDKKGFDVRSDKLDPDRVQRSFYASQADLYDDGAG
jgi:hypothetical protein